MGSVRRNLLTMAGVIAASGAVVAMAATPASAILYGAGSAGLDSFTYFESDGEILTSEDNHADGHGATAQWRYQGSSTINSYYNPNGAHNTKTWNLSLPENRLIDIRACLQDGAGGTPWSCGPWQDASTG
jgi:hypothetical protein